MRLNAQDWRLFRQAARSEGKPLAAWLREAGREHARRVKGKRAACLDYPDWPLSPEAERDKHFLCRKFAGKA